MTARAGEDFETAWALLELPIRRSLEHAYAALIAGGLGCGAVLTDASGAIVAEGRNRAYDPPGGDEILQGTPIAHAEMNVLAAVSTDLDLTGCILWTTQEPCSMCTAAMAFAGVGVVRYVAPDPWAIATEQSRATSAAGSADTADGPGIIGPVDNDVWIVTANLIFMLSIGRRRGPDHPTIAGNAELEPETTGVVRKLLADHEVELPSALEEFVGAFWTEIEVAAADRRDRRAHRRET
jgi:tRNA(Arg) A34 adenosine deaminase TadA